MSGVDWLLLEESLGYTWTFAFKRGIGSKPVDVPATQEIDPRRLMLGRMTEIADGLITWLA